MPRRPGLDRAAVVAAAIEMVNSEGAGALSLGRLADRLGVQTPSLYNHIDGLPGLRRELALANATRVGEAMAAAAARCSGPDALMAVARAYRGYIKEQPGLYMATVRAAGADAIPDAEVVAAEDRIVRIVMDLLAPYGLAGEDGLHAVRGLRSIVHGFATLEIAGGFGLPLDCDESFRRLVEMLIRSLPEAGAAGAGATAKPARQAKAPVASVPVQGVPVASVPVEESIPPTAFLLGEAPQKRDKGKEKGNEKGKEKSGGKEKGKDKDKHKERKGGKESKEGKESKAHKEGKERKG